MIVTTRWDLGLFLDDAPTALCRGCSQAIRPVGETGLWEDSAGVTVCVKLQPGDSGYVFHEPMPDGLLGALG